MIRSSALLALLALLIFALIPALPAAPADLARITSRADLESAIASTTDAALKHALQEHSAAILSAIEQRPHVEAVTRIVEGARGKVEKINATPEVPSFMIHTGDLSHLSKPSEFDTLDQVLKTAKPDKVFFVPGEHDIHSIRKSYQHELNNAEGRQKN